MRVKLGTSSKKKGYLCNFEKKYEKRERER